MNKKSFIISLVSIVLVSSVGYGVAFGYGGSGGPGAPLINGLWNGMYVLGGGTSKPAPTTQAVILPGQTATGLANALSSGAGYKFGILMRLGARSDTIKALQEKLRAEGFFTYPTSTGFFGSVTLTAVKAYQKAHGLVADGIAGPKTIAELNK